MLNCLSAQRAYLLISICLLEIYFSTKLNGIWEIIVPKDVGIVPFNFEDLFFRIPILSIIFIVAIYGKRLFDLFPKQQVSQKRFIRFVIIHILSVVAFFYLAYQLKIQEEVFVKPFLYGGFITLCLASISIWCSCFDFDRSELYYLIRHIWRPVTLCALLVILDKFFVSSYREYEGILSWFALPVKITIFEILGVLLRLYSDNIIIDMRSLEIGTSNFPVELGSGCAGIQGVNLFLIFSLLFYFLERERLTISLNVYVFFVLCGALVSFVINIFRVFFLIIIGDKGYKEWAMGSFHSHLGISISLILIIGFCLFMIYFYSKSEILHSLKKSFFDSPVNPYVFPFVC